MGPVALGSGLLLLLLSLIAKPMADANSGWTEQQGHQLEAATAHLHALSHQHGAVNHSHSDSVSDSEAKEDEFRAAQNEYAELRTELERARSRGADLARIARWSGIALIVVSVVMYAGRGF